MYMVDGLYQPRAKAHYLYAFGHEETKYAVLQATSKLPGEDLFPP